MCNLVSIAQRVGAPRIVPTRGIPWPAGDPTLARADEEKWRLRLLRTALKAISTPVSKPTVFEVPPVSDEQETGKKDDVGQTTQTTQTAQTAAESA